MTLQNIANNLVSGLKDAFQSIKQHVENKSVADWKDGSIFENKQQALEVSISEAKGLVDQIKNGEVSMDDLSKPNTNISNKTDDLPPKSSN